MPRPIDSVYTSVIHTQRYRRMFIEINTSRFGRVTIEADSIITFPTGLLGMEDCRAWVLLADERADVLAWLQSVERPEIALAVVSPRRFVPGCRLGIAQRELMPLDLDDVTGAEVLVIVGKTEHAVTLNLKAPVVINPRRRLGRQVVAKGDLPLAYELGSERAALRKSA